MVGEGDDDSYDMRDTRSEVAVPGAMVIIMMSQAGKGLVWTQMGLGTGAWSGYRSSRFHHNSKTHESGFPTGYTTTAKHVRRW